ncbi:MAG TPA: glycosyltransferase family 4 protein [Oscillatoriaceae cyanobacterium]
MRIALLAPVALPVPPTGYGGTELVVSMLAEGLVARGHDVTLFASGDSHTSARLESLYPQSLEAVGVRDKRTYQAYEAAHVRDALSRASRFDVVHDHTKALGTIYARFADTPVVTTIHNDFTEERRQVYGAHPDHAYVAISRAQAARMPELNYSGVVYNGLDLGPVIYQSAKEDYLLFLGRLDADKGAHTAIAIARALNWPLILAGRVQDTAFFEREIAPHLDGVRRRYVGEVAGEAKWRLYAGARALLFPIQWPEPFGLVMIEALACGTPVVATRHGSVPEVIEDGVSGRIVDSERDLDALVAATREAVTLDPRDCRAQVETRFSQDAMVEGYLDVYRQLVSTAIRR